MFLTLVILILSRSQIFDFRNIQLLSIQILRLRDSLADTSVAIATAGRVQHKA